MPTTSAQLELRRQDVIRLAVLLKNGRETDGLQWPDGLIPLERELLGVIGSQTSSAVVTVNAPHPDESHDDGMVSYTYTQAAERLGCSRSTVYRAVKAGTLPAVVVGKTKRIPGWAIRKRLGR